MASGALVVAGGGIGIGIGTGGGARSAASARASRGAMIAFSTLAEPQIGQATRLRFACLS